MVNWADHYATRVQRMIASDIRELARELQKPDLISFGGGVPEPILFQREVLAEAYAACLADDQSAKIALQYSDSAGYLPLREWLAKYMATLGVVCTPDNILITSGSQQGLDFIGRLFISPGDTVLVEMPTYIGVLRAFDSYEAKYEDVFGGNADAKFGYVMPDFQNPLGTSLSVQQRNALLDMAEARDMPLIEDSAYEKLRYDGEPLPSLLQLGIERTGGIENSRVIYTSTFSKTVAPALRVGWIIAPTQVIRKLILVKQASDLATSTINQMALLHAAPKILAKDNLAKVCAVYKRRRDLTLAALTKHMPTDLTWTKPEGGFYLWITLPQGIDGTTLASRALKEQRVAVISGKSCYAVRPVPNTIRLSFSLTPEGKIDEGIRRLAHMIRTMME